MLRHLRKRHQEVLDSESSRIKQKGMKKDVNNENDNETPKDKISTIPLQQQNANTNIQESDQQRSVKQDGRLDNKNDTVMHIGKPAKRRQNATLREQKEQREKNLIMFSKPTKPRVKTPSVAWIFFDVINKDTARCIICENIVPTPLWNTNGLLRHLKKDHLDECEQWEAENVHTFDASNISAGQIHPIWQLSLIHI